MLRRVIQASAEITKAEAASILLYDDNLQKLYFEATTNIENEEILRGIMVPKESIAGWVAENREAVIVNDVHKDERFFNQVEEKTNFTNRSIIAIPLIAKERLIGVLEVLNKINGDFGIHDLDTLQALGAQAAIAIENARLFQQSDLIAEMVHEIRTPLASISTIGHLLQHPEIPPEQKIKMAETIIQETNRLNDLATKFLNLARLEARRFAFNITTFDLNQIIKECYDILSPKGKENGIEFFLLLDPDIPLLQADRDKIKQVILNLVSNAIKYNKPDGKITIRTRHKQDDLIFSIQDTGYGIPENELHKLFEKFFRSKSTENKAVGTGLGLSISKRIIENLGGKIDVESKVNVGTTFTIYLKLKVD